MKMFLALSFSVFSLMGCVPKEAIEHDQAQIQKLVENSHASVDTCYKKAKARYAGLGQGELKIRADHNPDGSVSFVEQVSGFEGSAEVFSCIAKTVSTWKTQPPLARGPIELTWTFFGNGK